MDFGDSSGEQLLSAAERLAERLVAGRFRGASGLGERQEGAQKALGGETHGCEGLPEVAPGGGLRSSERGDVPAIAAVFDTRAEAEGAVRVLGQAGVAAFLTRRADDGTCEVVAQVRPSDAAALGRRLREDLARVQSGRLEEDARRAVLSATARLGRPAGASLARAGGACP